MLGSLLRRGQVAERSQLSFNEYLELVQPWLPQFTQSGRSPERDKPEQRSGFAKRAVTGNPVAFTAAAARMQVFSEVTFQFQDLATQELFGSPALVPLEEPWAGGSTGDVLMRNEMDATTAGNSFWVNAGSLVRSDRVNLLRLDPELTVILSERVSGQGGGRLGWAKAGYLILEDAAAEDGEFLDLREVAHYAPLPDPWAPWRGMSWLTPVLREIDADNALTEFKQAHIDNAATPNLVVTFDPSVTADKFKQLTEVIKRKMTGPSNAGKTLALAGGADVKVVGSSFEQLGLKAVQGAGETRIAAASRVPITVLNLSEGLQGSSLNQGNYGMARRGWADTGLRPMWRGVTSALSTLIDVPQGARLWWSERGVSFLQEDVKDEADIREAHSRTIRTLVEAGYDPATAVAAAVDGDFRALKHTGKVSVQLQEPGTQTEDPARSLALVLAERATSPAAGPSTHVHLPESLAVEVRQDDQLRAAVASMVERATSPEDLAAAFVQAAGSIPAPVVNVAAPVVNVEPPAVVVDVQAPVVNVPTVPVQLTLTLPEEHPQTKTVKLKVGDRTVTGTITES